jgi:hypothetical protein
MLINIRSRRCLRGQNEVTTRDPEMLGINTNIGCFFQYLWIAGLITLAREDICGNLKNLNITTKSYNR